ncbi:hypothetical protein SDC9_124258 [bioreactor metagenome]|uniref:Uncharacterized protein n=1 Tax=bioreactor metagenome TaxID=1076179 RepID=A0A645CK27_9ZZZZ
MRPDRVGTFAGQHGDDLALVIRLGFALHNPDRPLRTFADAGAEAVAKKIADQPRLAVDQLQRALLTVRNAQAAAVAFGFINLNDLAFHVRLLAPASAIYGFRIVLNVSNNSSPFRTRSKP